MSRSSKKGVYVDEKLLKKVTKAIKTNDRRPIKTWARRSVITPDFVGSNLNVHTGKAFVSVFVTENMVGHRVGEFAPTKTFRSHSAAKDKVKKMAAGAKT